MLRVSHCRVVALVSVIFVGCSVPNVEIKEASASGGATAGQSMNRMGGNAGMASSAEVGGNSASAPPNSTGGVLNATGGSSHVGTSGMGSAAGLGGSEPTIGGATGGAASIATGGTQTSAITAKTDGGVGGGDATGGAPVNGGLAGTGQYTVAGAAGSVVAPAPKCGNQKCDDGETEQSCCVDCGCSSGFICRSSACIKPLAIAAGGYHSCLLLDGGNVVCWGSNEFGELGNGAPTVFPVVKPVPVSGLTGARAIAAGSTFTCAVMFGGTVKCWGDNSAGQLGNGTRAGASTPVPVSELQNVTHVAAGFNSACARLGDSTVKCWGSNSMGQLGDGTTEGKSTPVVVTELTDATSVAVGYDFACATLASGGVKCWGNNADGQLGIGTSTDSLVPKPVLGITTAVSLAAMCDEVPGNSLPPPQVHGSMCALLSDRTARCWGNGLLGDLGTGSIGSSLRPLAVKGLSDAISIAGGDKFGCAILTDGTGRCWGNNVAGQLGDASTAKYSMEPVVVKHLSDAGQIAAGAWHACALLKSGAVKCWGTNTYRELGNDEMQSSNVPVEMNW